LNRPIDDKADIGVRVDISPSPRRRKRADPEPASARELDEPPHIARTPDPSFRPLTTDSNAASLKRQADKRGASTIRRAACRQHCHKNSG